MVINIPDPIIREFLGGVSAVLAVIAVGTFLWFILRGIARKFTFTRMALVLALAPLSLINFLGNSESSALLIYAGVTTLLGITIDGINHLLMPNEQLQPNQNPAKQADEIVESNLGVLVWEKAVKKCIHLVYMLLIIMAVLFVSTFWVLIENTHLIDKRVKELIDTHEKQLAGKRSREAFGEGPLSTPISNMMPENSHSLQHTVDNGVCADCILFPPEPSGAICIDSKFPLESYLRMTDAILGDADRKTAEQQFLQEVKKSPKTFWSLVENTHLIGNYHKVKSMEILKSMEAEVLRNEIENLKEFIKNNCRTSP